MLQDAIGFLSVTPHFVGASGVGFAPVGGCLAVEPVSMQAEYGTERAELEPAHQQFAVFGIILVAAMKTADICRPPGDASHAHAQPDS